jgi:hypothetical protein
VTVAADAPKEVLEFFAMLPHSHKALCTWLEARSRSYDVRMRKERDDVTFRHVQGRAQEINDLLDMIQQAPAILEKQRKAS